MALLEVRRLFFAYPAARGVRRPSNEAAVLTNISFTLRKGESLAVVGESGSGKSTLARIVAGLLKPERGSVFFEGRTPSSYIETGKPSPIQLVFQNYSLALNPFLTVREIISEGLWGVDVKNPEREVRRLLGSVQLSETLADARPSNLSGGEKQRVSIARAIAARPALLVLDEPTSSLDAVTKAGILDCIAGIRIVHGIGILLITHDLEAAAETAERIGVLSRGELVELEPTTKLLRQPQHPFTRTLIEAMLPPARQ